MAVRIYADMPSNQCGCSGKFTKRVPHSDDESLIVPRCDKCNQYPEKFLIDADTVDINGAPKREKIRYTQNGDKLDKIGRVTYTLERVVEEIKDGTFDIRKYASKNSRENFIFRNFIKSYLEHQSLRLKDNQITPKGLKDKTGLINREILPFFGDVDIIKINGPMIRRFKASFLGKDKDRTRDLALGELKTILKEACRDGILTVVPEFEKIDRSKPRKDVISLELAIRTISLMHKQMYRDMYALMTIYPIRPCEVRALKWKNIDFEKDEFTITHHFSDEILIKGRKSIKDGEMATMTYPMTNEVREIFRKYREDLRVTPINWKDSYIFIGRFGNHISDETLRDSWVNARKKAGHTYQAYECRHAITSEIYIRSGGDLIATSKASGHTTTAMVSSRYVRVAVDKKKLYGA